MEGDEPVSVELIYERILRRGSLQFLGYKRPFRAITGAMSALRKRGEVALELRNGSSSVPKRDQQRLWRRVLRER
jgi:hypothetical protein